MSNVEEDAGRSGRSLRQTCETETKGSTTPVRLGRLSEGYTVPPPDEGNSSLRTEESESRKPQTTLSGRGEFNADE